MYRPWLNRLIGVEMEVNTVTADGCGIDADALRDTLREALVNAGTDASRINEQEVSYYHSTGQTWDVKSDSSCGYEIASPALALDIAGHNVELRAVCAALAAIAPQIDGRCGLHVHVDCHDYTWQQIQMVLRLWVLYEPFFFDCCPATRAGNTYCAALRQSRWHLTADIESNTNRACQARTERQFLAALNAMTRRRALNLNPWQQSGRLEFRLAAGTVNYEKIRRWAMLLLAVVGRANATHLGQFRYAFQQPTAVAPTRHVMRVLGLIGRDAGPEGAALERWVTHRRSKFNPLAAPVHWTPLPERATV